MTDFTQYFHQFCFCHKIRTSLVHQSRSLWTHLDPASAYLEGTVLSQQVLKQLNFPENGPWWLCMPSLLEQGTNKIQTWNFLHPETQIGNNLTLNSAQFAFYLRLVLGLWGPVFMKIPIQTLFNWRYSLFWPSQAHKVATNLSYQSAVWTKLIIFSTLKQSNCSCEF